MRASRLNRRALRLLRRLGWRGASRHSGVTKRRGARDHVIILDGTDSSLLPGHETNAGLTYRLLREAGAPSVYYEAGLQWEDWGATLDVMMGRGINRQICRAYGFLASRYRAGDRIFLLGYSRGAYAVRSLAGVIDRIGLLRQECATERNITQAYRLYRGAPGPDTIAAFAERCCHPQAPVEMVGVWDTVKALGLRLPYLWRLTEANHAFHNHELGATIRHGYHALAHDETRVAYSPILWSSAPEHTGHIDQVWFRGTHGDIGGQLMGFHAARPLSNIPLVWMLERMESHGITLPEGWHSRFPRDADAPSAGSWRGMSKVFLLRGRRIVGQDPSERLHHTLRAALPDTAVRAAE